MSVTANYGIVFFMPQIIKGIGLTNMMTGLVSSIPYIIGTIGLIAWGFSSDRAKERRWHLIAASTRRRDRSWLSPRGPARPIGRCSECQAPTVGIYGSRAAFWPMPSTVPHRHGGRRRDRDDQRGQVILAVISVLSSSAGSRIPPANSKRACISSPACSLDVRRDHLSLPRARPVTPQPYCAPMQRRQPNSNRRQ